MEREPRRRAYLKGALSPLAGLKQGVVSMHVCTRPRVRADSACACPCSGMALLRQDEVCNLRRTRAFLCSLGSGGAAGPVGSHGASF